MKKKSSIWKSLKAGIFVVIGIVIFAYAFKVTDVNFGLTRSNIRIQQLTRVLRALAKPDLVRYETSEIDVSTPFYLPCPTTGELAPPEYDKKEPYITTSELCASPKEKILVEGYNFPSGQKGPINFLASSGVKRQLGNFEANNNGNFVVEVEVPNRQPVDKAQYIVATIRSQSGLPMWSDTAKATWEKIIETVFIALLATTIGTAASIPISFIAARNLMKDSTSTPTSTALNIIGFPAGFMVGYLSGNWLLKIVSPIGNQLLIVLVGLIICGFVAFLALKRGFPSEDIKKTSTKESMIRSSALFTALVAIVLFFILFGHFSKLFGTILENSLEVFGFFGYALFQLGDITLMLIPAVAAITVGGIVAGVLNKFGLAMQNKLASGTLKLVNILLLTASGAILFWLIMALINWFYQFTNPKIVHLYPIILGGAVGLIVGLIVKPKHPMPTGFIIYTITRTLLNATRSIEPLVMAIVAVIWVGIGPFAGSLALALHTVAALAKLYSEQVESIDDGPLEAVQATGANKLQTIIYAVIPQIIPPYISFTMYRWDINVRMSTIIGFVGGGGIGFLLQQNINLLSYRAAAVQMLAIAVVVATMDYLSSKIREKIV